MLFNMDIKNAEILADFKFVVKVLLKMHQKLF
jgi:hypothetical protein